MITSPEFEPQNYHSTREIIEATAPQLDAAITVTRLEMILDMATDVDEDDRVENGMLIRPDGTFPVPTQEDIDAAIVNLQEIETSIRQELGISDDIDIVELRKIASILDVQERMKLDEENGGKYHYSEVPFASDYRLVPNFLKAVRAISRLTGKPQTVWINKYCSEQAIITPETDIAELTARAKAKDREACQAILRSRTYRDEEKSHHSLEQVEKWYAE